MAETATYKVSGMHCGGCKTAIQDSVCKKMPDLASCSVELIDTKKQTGKIVLVSKDGTAIDDKKVSELVTAVGEYKATRTSEKAAAKK
jgi:copper chaperone CopZ